MRMRVGDRLPTFSIEDRARIQGSCDFFGLNHYNTMYAAHRDGGAQTDVYGNGGISEDQDVALSVDPRSEEHTSELQSRGHLVCRLLLAKKNSKHKAHVSTVYLS